MGKTVELNVTKKEFQNLQKQTEALNNIKLKSSDGNKTNGKKNKQKGKNNKDNKKTTKMTRKRSLN